jgi:PEP-CTERM motif
MQAARRCVLLLVVALSLVIWSPGMAEADLIVSNLDQTTIGFSSQQADAQSFTVGAASQPLGSVTLLLKNNNPAENASVTVSLNSDSSGLPGGSLLLLGTITIPASTGYMNYTLQSPSPVTLQTGTTYWIEAESVFDPTQLPVEWADTISTTTTGTGTLGTFAEDISGVGFLPVSGHLLQLEVDSVPAVSTPEPSSLALLGTAGATLAGWLWRRKRSA